LLCHKVRGIVGSKGVIVGYKVGYKVVNKLVKQAQEGVSVTTEVRYTSKRGKITKNRVSSNELSQIGVFFVNINTGRC
jgi:hypothetical protein